MVEQRLHLAINTDHGRLHHQFGGHPTELGQRAREHSASLRTRCTPRPQATGPAVAVPRGRRIDLRPAYLLRYSARWQVTTGLGVRLGAVSGMLT